MKLILALSSWHSKSTSWMFKLVWVSTTTPACKPCTLPLELHCSYHPVSSSLDVPTGHSSSSCFSFPPHISVHLCRIPQFYSHGSQYEVTHFQATWIATLFMFSLSTACGNIKASGYESEVWYLLQILVLHWLCYLGHPSSDNFPICM